MDAFDANPLCPSPTELQLHEILFVAPELIVVASSRRHSAVCPVCGHSATRIHSRYRRTLADLPWHNLRVRLDIRVRRFFCDMPNCSRHIFTERLSKTAAPYARRTARAASALEAIALALGARAGARLANALGLIAAPGALLGLLHNSTGVDRIPPDNPGEHSDEATPAPRVLGVDDWAWRKGTRYGTILVDLERHRVIDMLPDREPETFAAWLTAHPGIEFISRDRAGGYAEGARTGAPNAIQIADRFHLLRNLTDAMQYAVKRHQDAIRAIGLEPHVSAGVPFKRGGPVSRPPDALPVSAQRKRLNREHRHERYTRVIELKTAGASVAEIHRAVGLSRATITRWLETGTFPERQPRVHRRTSLTLHAEFLAERWQTGCRSATALWLALRDERGFRGGVTTVRDWVRAHLRGRTAASDPRTRTARPSARRAAWLLTASSERLNAAEQDYVSRVCQASPPLESAHRLALEFRMMLDAHEANQLRPWLDAAVASELRILAHGLRRDYDAVLAAMLFPWSNGQVEGQVSRLKLVKRTMYGRASFPLLRRRVLSA